MALKEGRSNARWNIFRDEEMEFQFMRTMATLTENGAEIGECLNVKKNTQDKDIDSLANAWTNTASFVEKVGDNQLEKNNIDSATKSYLRASNYYRSAMNCLSPKNKWHFENWKNAKACFEKAGALFDHPFEPIKIPFEKGFLPCYFLRPSHKKEKRPTLIVVTGGEGTAMEMYFWCAREGLRRNYNILLCEITGNISTIYENSSLTLREDTEVPIGRVLDFVETRETVDVNKIALIGYSAGGYFAARAAAFDHRIKALICNSALRDIHGMFTAVFPKILLSSKLSSFVDFSTQHFISKATKNSIELILWESGIEQFSELLELTKRATLIGIEDKITCPTLALSGEGEGELFLKQSETFFRNISSSIKTSKVFTEEEGASAHCQIDNLTLARSVIYDWLDSIF
ncbi:alpha/beta hydrolase family protein [Streptococcus sp. CSL10205-OR2]|uniref:alpha/beta hydrolase family protein n=1 Tax=Streptococcus sp. CSL10205-OR2 TaxID=2980558 RepID=UPI0021D8803B|nr:alpha/beta hydrolase [Streptococcus sp. CSL10205-OR2]MCU9533706.1 alpha/beta hydrolase [Streptococcus sp. CSL10205-OR2]